LLYIIAKAVKYLLMVTVILYAVDWCVFEVRYMRGAGISSVQVDQFLKTPLKGSKAEYDYLGTGNQNCALAGFPQYAGGQWNAPCWWLKRHAVSWQ
jgi:hypothetical protein